MPRAAIAIGVNKTTALAELKGAARDAKKFADWIGKHGAASRLMTDEAGTPVTFTDIFNEVKRIVDARTYSQLIIYFAGHGFRSGGSEVWLLSGAPDNAREAIGLEASIMAARESGLRSVVFVSDACRSVPATLELSRVDGGSIFPNKALDRSTRPEIDRFFATLPSMVAVEAKSANDAARRDGIFTREFIEVHRNTPKDFVERVNEGGQSIEVIWNRTLRNLIREKVEDAVYGIEPEAGQLPDSIVESDKIYIGQVERLVQGAKRPVLTGDDTIILPDFGLPVDRGLVFAPKGIRMPDDYATSPPRRSRGKTAPRPLSERSSRRPPPKPSVRLASVAAVASEAVQAASAGRRLGEGTASRRDLLAHRAIADASGLSDAVKRYAVPAQVEHYESQTGFAVTGTTVVKAMSSQFKIDLLGDSLIRAWPKPNAGAGSVVIRFAERTGTVLPVLIGFIGQASCAAARSPTSITYRPPTARAGTSMRATSLISRICGRPSQRRRVLASSVSRPRMPSNWRRSCAT